MKKRIITSVLALALAAAALTAGSWFDGHKRAGTAVIAANCGLTCGG